MMPRTLALREFVRLARWIKIRIERNEGSLWWQDIEKLTWKLESLRKSLDELPSGRVARDMPPALLVYAASRDLRWGGRALAEQFSRPFERYAWLQSIVTMKYSDPADEIEVLQHLRGTVNPVEYLSACESEDIDPDDSHLFVHSCDIACERPMPLELPGLFVVGPQARVVAMDCLQKWVDAVQLMDISQFEIQRNPFDAAGVSNGPEINESDPRKRFTFGELRRRIRCDAKTLRAKAISAGIRVPVDPSDKDFLYHYDEWSKICAEFVAHSRIKGHKTNAEQLVKSHSAESS